MGISVLSAQRSKDPNRQVGACIVDSNHRIMGIGYNGFPRGCSDHDLPWNGKEVLKEAPDMVMGINDEVFLETKYPYVCHAEANAILNSHSRSLDGCTIYVSMFPCNECTKLLIQAGIKKVVYMSDKNHDHPVWIASRRMLDMTKVEYKPFVSTRDSVITIALTNTGTTTIDSTPLVPHSCVVVDEAEEASQKKVKKEKKEKKEKNKASSEVSPSSSIASFAWGFLAGVIMLRIVAGTRQLPAADVTS